MNAGMAHADGLTNAQPYQRHRKGR